jgi:hypothetical protein
MPEIPAYPRLAASGKTAWGAQTRPTFAISAICSEIAFAHPHAAKAHRGHTGTAFSDLDDRRAWRNAVFRHGRLRLGTAGGPLG